MAKRPAGPRLGTNDAADAVDDAGKERLIPAVRARMLEGASGLQIRLGGGGVGRAAIPETFLEKAASKQAVLRVDAAEFVPAKSRWVALPEGGIKCTCGAAA